MLLQKVDLCFFSCHIYNYLERIGQHALKISVKFISATAAAISKPAWTFGTYGMFPLRQAYLWTSLNLLFFNKSYNCKQDSFNIMLWQ